MNPAHIRWTQELRAKAQEIRDASPNAVIATEIFNEIFGFEIKPGTFRRAVDYYNDSGRRNARKRELAGRPAVQKKKRPCLNQCGRIVDSTGPHHRLCDKCRADISSLPVQFG